MQSIDFLQKQNIEETPTEQRKKWMNDGTSTIRNNLTKKFQNTMK